MSSELKLFLPIEEVNIGALNLLIPYTLHRPHIHPELPHKIIPEDHGSPTVGTELMFVDLPQEGIRTHLLFCPFRHLEIGRRRKPVRYKV